eukprot:5681521-Amphidinium_carterae.1
MRQCYTVDSVMTVPHTMIFQSISKGMKPACIATKLFESNSVLAEEAGISMWRHFGLRNVVGTSLTHTHTRIENWQRESTWSHGHTHKASHETPCHTRRDPSEGSATFDR